MCLLLWWTLYINKKRRPKLGVYSVYAKLYAKSYAFSYKVEIDQPRRLASAGRPVRRTARCHACHNSDRRAPSAVPSACFMPCLALFFSTTLALYFSTLFHSVLALIQAPISCHSLHCSNGTHRSHRTLHRTSSSASYWRCQRSMSNLGRQQKGEPLP